MLDFISNFDKPLEKVNIIIKESSFIPNFNGHLTLEVLKKISNKEIQKSLKRHLIREKIVTQTESLTKQKSPDSNSHEAKNKKKIIEQKPSLSKSNDLSMIIDNFSPSKPSQENVTKKISNSEDRVIITNSTTESTRSTVRFAPIAKNYDTNYEILSDPTGKLYTLGEYNDFYQLTIDKYNSLRKLMKRRGDTFSATKIKNILRNTQDQDIAVIGMVNDLKKTAKGNYFITLEDNSGIINAVVRKDIDNHEIINTIENLILDQVIFLQGTYKPADKGKNGIIFANNLTKIDIPRDFQPNKSTEPLSIALISDTHIGSKEFEENLWNRFIKLLNGEIGDKKIRSMAGKIKYIIINGDLVDGIGVYPNQEDDLVINDIYQQYRKAQELLSEIPEYIKIFYSSGNHEPVRNAIPRPAVPKKYAHELISNNITCVGNPAIIKTHNVNTLIFHGDSLIDLNQMVPSLENDKPIDSMRELLICRHLAPAYGKKTQIAPIDKDWLVIDKVPDIFHTGHIHINGMDSYRNVILVNSGCFQSQTDFMKSFGIKPTPGIISFIELDTLRGSLLDLKNI
jgi:DNA polymerase II small subunit